ncbi:hypothetical protein JIG36_01715 [Actinoplanes sp. LDG1-06]|uniref:MmpS family membrane protein n=1 Tax=Paractinoplanes ovalisporus TaxID=2810368 RepID=A0ABS2A4V9_9ACTN|nr:hypothetical protein [Actinoplanes ovalisporus]MBM2614271.1 hypothetical protein [Actinoplanes ovalisporus]
METAPTSPMEHVSFDERTTVDPFAPAFNEGEAPARRERGRRGWLVAAAAVAVLACLGGALFNPFDNDKTPDRAGPKPGTTTTASPEQRSTAKPKASASTGTGSEGGAQPIVATVSPDLVVYVVSSTNKGDVASVQYTDQDRDIIRKGEVALPWRHTFRIVGDKPPLVIVAQRKKGGTGPVTCSISLGGKELSTAVQRGRYASPQCAG